MEGEGFLLGRCHLGKQREPSHYSATAHRKWSKEDNKISYIMLFTNKGRTEYWL